MVLQAIKYSRGKLEILDQLQLPHQQVYISIENPQDAWDAIQKMQVRGAPAIAIVAALSLAVYLENVKQTDIDRIGNSSTTCAGFISRSLKFLVTSRPTAVNLADAARKLEHIVLLAGQDADATFSTIRQGFIEAAEKMLVDDVRDNENIGKFGAEWIHTNLNTFGDVSVLTHCNTGSLATAGFGTALGVVRALHGRGILRRAFYTETRPYNQGSRLTGFELLHDRIPATLITDSMAASLLKLKKNSDHIAGVVVGADRVAANGDTANKIGTYSLAILARHHGVKFLVAAPRTTIDLMTASGEEIVIEERRASEVTSLKGSSVSRQNDGTSTIDISAVHEISLTPFETNAWNPAFDVTPADLIDGIVTETGVVEKNEKGKFDLGNLFTTSQGAMDNANTSSNHVGDDHSIEPHDSFQTGNGWKHVLNMKPSDVSNWESWAFDMQRPPS